MITSKRQIRKESERFGGYYGTESNDIPRFSDLDISNTVPDIDNGPKQEAPSAMAAKATETPAPAHAAPEAKPVHSQTPHNEEDIRPTLKSLQFADAKPIQEIEREIEADSARAAQRRPRAALDGKIKVWLAVYVVVALFLAVAVIATGISISNASAEADVIAASVAQKQAVVAQQMQELAELQDADVIRGKAIENGMVDSGEPDFTVGNVESTGYPEAKPRTDGWDEWFDWMSKVFN